MEDKERELVFQAISNYKNTHDEREFNVIYHLICDELSNHIKKYSRSNKRNYSKDEIDELVHLTTVKIWKGLDKIDNSRSFFKWMNLAADHTCLDYWDKAAKRYEINVTDYAPETNETEEKTSFIERIEGNEEANSMAVFDVSTVISSCMDTLDVMTKDLVQMKFLDELEYSEIAERTGLTQGTIRSKISRAKAKLGSAMKEELARRGMEISDLSLSNAY